MFMRLVGVKKIAGLMVIGFLAMGSSQATIIVDLTTVGSSGFVNAGLFQQVTSQPTGTGFIDSFVEIGRNTDVVHAYNTTDNGTLDNGASNNFNRQIQISDINTVLQGGILYREFLLDINQTGADSLLSLDEVQIFLSTLPNQNVETFNGSGILELASSSLIYRLDAGMNNRVELDFNVNGVGPGGSGKGDMLMLIPDALFVGADTQFVYLYSRFGENNNNNDGFEEWTVREGGKPVIPEPGTVMLISAGIVGLATRRRRLN